MPRIKLSFPFDWPLSRQTPQHSCQWGDYTFVLNASDDDTEGFDAWFVFERIIGKKEKTFCPKENMVFITGEPPTIRMYSNLFIRQFNHVITCHQRVRNRHKHNILQGHPWFPHKSYDELTQIETVEKTKLLSVITSNVNVSKEHRQRIKFCFQLKEYFGDKIDLFGRGFNDFKDKWDVLAPYKYSIVIENAVLKNWMTEKIGDCYLAHTFPIYHGGPSAEDYFPPQSLQRIDINKFDEAKKIIEELFADDNHYQQRLPWVKEAKDKVLNKYNIFPLLADFATANLKMGSPRQWNSVKKEGSLIYRLTKRIL